MRELYQELESAFHHCNIRRVSTHKTVAHGGKGEINFARLLTQEQCQGALNFVDIAELPPGSSIGLHRHKNSEEEYYLILEGEGRMHRGQQSLNVQKGDFIRNPPEGLHGLLNTGHGPLRLFVFEVQVR